MARARKKKKVIDWNRIERDFRSGKWSTRQLAEIHGPTEGAIRYQAKVGNWSQMVRPDEEEVETFQKRAFVTPAPTPPEAKVIVIEGKGLALRMLDELGATTSLQGELEDMIIKDTSKDKDGRRRQGMMRAVDLPSRAKILRDLMVAAKTAIEVQKLERAADSPEYPSTETTVDDKPADDWDRLLN